MGGGTGTGAAPVIAKTAKELGVLTVAVVTKPFEFEGQRRMRAADEGIRALAQHVDTLIVIPNQNLFRIASEKTTFADAFLRADEVLKSGVCCITDLMIKEGLINLDFADVRTVMQNMGTALMGTGEAEGEKRALQAAEAAISNPLLGEISMRGAKGLLVSITGSFDMTLYEVEEAASRIRREVDPDENPDVNIIVGATFDTALQNRLRVSVVATGISTGLDFTPQHPAPSGVASPRGKDMRLADRLSTASGNGENGRNASNSGEQNWPGKQGSSRDDASGRRVVIEPKSKKAMDHEPRGHGMAPEASPGFEPIPPAKTMRPPRRPLTFQDFPELSQTAPAKNGAPEGRNPSKQRGFFDWMAGRVRNSDKSESRSAAGKTVVLKPRSPGERENYGEDSTRLQGGGRGSQELEPGRAISDGAGSHQGLPEDEAIEIPDFFKKPLT
jgi:cell division protein FtsZ